MNAVPVKQTCCTLICGFHKQIFERAPSAPAVMIDTAKTCPAVDEGFISAPPGHGAGKDAHKCEACSLYFTSAQALDGHRATSREHQDNLARIEGGAVQERKSCSTRETVVA